MVFFRQFLKIYFSAVLVMLSPSAVIRNSWPNSFTVTSPLTERKEPVKSIPHLMSRGAKGGRLEKGDALVLLKFLFGQFVLSMLGEGMRQGLNDWLYKII